MGGRGRGKACKAIRSVLEIGMASAAIKISSFELWKSVDSQGSEIVSAVAGAILPEGEGAQHLSRQAGANGCPHSASAHLDTPLCPTQTLTLDHEVVRSGDALVSVSSMWKGFRLAVHCHTNNLTSIFVTDDTLWGIDISTAGVRP